MAAPKINIASALNGDAIQLYWDLDAGGTYRGYNVYYSITDATMAVPTKIGAEIPNVADTLYSTRHVYFIFRRSVTGIATDKDIFVRVRGVSPAGVEDAANQSSIRVIPAMS